MYVYEQNGYILLQLLDLPQTNDMALYKIIILFSSCNENILKQICTTMLHFYL